MKTKKIELKKGDVYQSTNYGDFTVISIGGEGTHPRKATIQFNNTGAIHTASIYNIIRGNVRDKSVPAKRIDNVVLDYDKEYQSKNYGKYKIIADAGRNARHVRMVRIKFLDTGYETDIAYSLAMSGEVRDHITYNEKHKIDTTKEYQSKNYGNFIIIKQIPSYKNHARMVNIRFINTGATADVLLANALKGNVKDPSLPSIRDAKRVQIDINKVYTSKNYGKYRIIADAGSDQYRNRLVKILFEETGYTYITQYANAVRGNVKDQTKK